MLNNRKETSIIIELFNKSEEVRDILQKTKEVESTPVANGLIQVDNDTARIISEEISKAGITSRLVTLLKQVCRLNINSRAIAITPLLNEDIIVGLINAADENILCSIEALFLFFHIIKTLPVNAYILEFFVRILYSDGSVKEKIPVINIESLKYLYKSTYWRLVLVMLFMKMVLELHNDSEEFVKIEDYLTAKNESLLESTLVILWQFATNSDILNSIDVSCNYYDLFSNTYEKIENSITVHLKNHVSVLQMLLNVLLKVPKETFRQETVIFFHSLLMIQQLCRCTLHSKQVSTETLYSDLQQNSNSDEENQEVQEFPPVSQFVDTKQKKKKSRRNRTCKTQMFLSNLRTTVFITKEYMLDLCVDDETELFLEMFNRRSPCQRMLDISRLCAREGMFDMDFVFSAANHVYKMREQRHRPRDRLYTSSSIKRAINTANKFFNTVLINTNYEDRVRTIIKNHLLKGDKMQQTLEFNYEQLIRKLLDNFAKCSALDNKSSQDYWTLCSNASRKVTQTFQRHLEAPETETTRVSKLTKTDFIMFSIPLKLVHLQLVSNASVRSLGLCIVADYVFSFVDRRKDVGSVLVPRGSAAVNKVIVKETLMRLLRDGNPACRRLAVSYVSRHLHCGVRCGGDGDTGMDEYGEDDEYDDLILDELLEPVNSQTLKPASHNVTSATVSMNKFFSTVMLCCLSDKSRAVQDAALKSVLERLKGECRALLGRDDVVERARVYATVNSFIIPVIAKGVIVLDNDIYRNVKECSVEERLLVLRDILVVVIEMLMEVSRSGLVNVQGSAKEMSLVDALSFCVQGVIECILSGKRKMNGERLYKDIKSDDIPLETLKSVIHRIAFITLTSGVRSENDT